jgi:hypothetical protein
MFNTTTTGTTHTAISLRDQALFQVAENSGSWMDLALQCVDCLVPKEYTGEDIRLIVERIIGKPHHHNAWGAVIRTSLKRNYIVATGEYRAMKIIKSHARKTPVYRRW